MITRITIMPAPETLAVDHPLAMVVTRESNKSMVQNFDEPIPLMLSMTDTLGLITSLELGDEGEVVAVIEHEKLLPKGNLNPMWQSDYINPEDGRLGSKLLLAEIITPEVAELLERLKPKVPGQSRVRGQGWQRDA